MPIEIKELVIRASVQKNLPIEQESINNRQLSDQLIDIKEEILEACYEKITDLIKDRINR